MAGRKRATYIAVCFSFLIFIVIPLYGQQPAPSIFVTGSVTTPLTLTAEALAQMPRAMATVSSDGIDTQYEGVWLHEILKKAGLPAGEALRGKMLTKIEVVQVRK